MNEYIEQMGDDVFFVAASPIMHKLRAQAALIAKLGVPVLIVGEIGSGKEVFARLIHKLSTRSACKFLKVSCATIPSDVLDAELFGSVRSVSGVRREVHAGTFEICNKGTVLLDDITEIPLGLQGQLLHVLQENKIFRAGSDTSVAVDVRILATSRINIEQAVAEKRLREDLYYQLSAFTLQVPPLRKRKEEIPFLLRHCMDRMAKYYRLPAQPLSRMLLDRCVQYSWPGNLAELQTFVKRYLVMGDELLGLGELRDRGYHNGDGRHHDDAKTAADRAEADPNLKTLVRTIKGDAEKAEIVHTLDKTEWNRKQAARLLGISYRGLLYKIQQYGLAPSACVSTMPRNGGGVDRAS